MATMFLRFFQLEFSKYLFLMNGVIPLSYLLTKTVTSMCAITPDPFPLLLSVKSLYKIFYIEDLLCLQMPLACSLRNKLDLEKVFLMQIIFFFYLYAIVQKQFSKNQKLYMAFIDYKKCVDSINRQALFKTLECNEIIGNFLNAIKALYATVLAAVRNNSQTSYYFQCPIGLQQGCLLSPTLFTIFIAEVSKFINAHAKHGVQFMPGLKTIHHLFFADDEILVSDTIRGLQIKLNLIEMQSERLGLEVNLDKTQIVKFRKGGHLSKYEHWHYGTNSLNVVYSYKFLGVDFSTKLSFVNCKTPFIMKAKNHV